MADEDEQLIVPLLGVGPRCGVLVGEASAYAAPTGAAVFERPRDGLVEMRGGHRPGPPGAIREGFSSPYYVAAGVQSAAAAQRVGLPAAGARGVRTVAAGRGELVVKSVKEWGQVNSVAGSAPR